MIRKRNRLLLYFILSAALLSSLSLQSQSFDKKGSLTVIVKNIRNNTGQVGFCLFNTEIGFPNHPEKAIARAFVKLQSNSAVYIFSDIPFGMYAVSVFHDENNDKKINSNLFGIPKEGVGVSNNAKGHLGPPKFDDAKFNFSKAGQTISISISYL